MSDTKGIEIAEPKGKLGVLLVGLGAVSTTFIAGVEAIRRPYSARNGKTRGARAAILAQYT